MHLDLGAILAIIGIILIIPGGVIATILTPKVQSWWGLTSRRRMAERRVKLLKKLGQIDLLDSDDLAERRWSSLMFLSLSIYGMATSFMFDTLFRVFPPSTSRVGLILFIWPSIERFQQGQAILYFLSATSAAVPCMTILRAHNDARDKRHGITRRELANLDRLLNIQPSNL